MLKILRPTWRKCLVSSLLYYLSGLNKSTVYVNER